ncbi:hypothetical protein N431DRAFT_444301 [Stipitochalara longipes BDJ]|nr:hypothetical protein N431DRAFT_444301 [Stipitochalara longipes BDJ]
MAGVDDILRVIPLLVEVAKFSHTVYQQFKRWRKYASKLEEFQEELLCYHCVFRKDCSLLLRSVTITTESDWIMERDLTELENAELERNLSSYLDDQYTCCGLVMKKIKKELDILHAKSQRFQDAITVPDSARDESIEKRKWRSFKAKTEFSVTGPELKERLETLWKHSNIFRTILEQARIASMQNKRNFQSLPAPDDSTLLKISSVQTVANKLYNALLDSCTGYNEYAVYLRLQIQRRDGPELGKVNFDLRLHPVSKDNFKSPHFPLQLRTDELACDTSSARHAEPPTESLHELSNLRKRRHQSLYVVSDIKRIKTNDSENTVPRHDLSLLSIEDNAPPVTLPHAISTESPSICYPSNKLHGEQNRIGEQPSHPTEYEEHLELAKIIKDLGHQVISDAAPFYFLSPTSLADHISNWPSMNYNNLYQTHEILFLAKHIASAVLYFHATPFLEENWTSQCIALFDVGGKLANKRPMLTGSHLKLLIPHRHKQDNEFESVTSRPRTMIRNPYTFTLGIVLIELAHQKPWQLLKDEDNQSESNAFATKFDLVDRLAVGMTTFYSIDYGKMVRKCINCDFGEGEYDLKNPRLQMAFYRDVVCVLEKMEQDSAKLQKGR